MSRGAQLICRRGCYPHFESLTASKPGKMLAGNIQSRSTGSYSRRRSLTLATTWGEPIFQKNLPERRMSARRYHTKGEMELGLVQRSKRRSSQVSATLIGDANSVSACPFHALFASKSERGSDISSTMTSTGQNLSSGAVASRSVASTVRHVMSVYYDAKKQNLKRARDLAKGLLKAEKFATKTHVKDYSSIPGPRGLPLLGSVLDYTFLGPFSPRQFHKALRSRHSKYGKIFREKFLSEEFVYTSDPADLQVLVHNEDAAPCRPHIDAIVESRTQQDYPVGITSLQGEEWARLRRPLNSAIMNPKVVRSYADAQKKVADEFVEFMKKEKCPTTGEIADLEVWLNRWALESVAVILLDTRLGLISPDKRKKSDPIAERLRKAMDVFFDYGARLTFSAPIWKLWQTKDWKIFCKSQKDEFEAAGYYVDKKLEEIKADTISEDKGEKAASFLEHLLNKSDLKRDESVTLCLELLAGGIDTTSNAVTFTLFELTKNKKCQEKLRELIRQDAENKLTGNNSESAIYLKSCVKEALRLHPLTYVNMRKTNRELVLSGYRIPAETTVRYTPHLMHLRNEEYFPSPNEFIPDRWMSRTSPYRCTTQFVFTPFGHGARQCPGRRIAEQELDLLLRGILLNFNVEYHHQDIGVEVRLFNGADKPAKFSFIPLGC